jgi:uncharacterized protein (TIGR03083 family)
VTACDGWTVHELTAHLVGTAVEVVRHLDPWLQGEPVPPTRSFEVREAPFRTLDDRELRYRLEIEEETMRAMIDQALAREPDADIAWTGRRMAVAKFIPHLRSEFAIHGWDFSGGGEDLLAQPDLTEHAVGVLGRILPRKGSAGDPGSDFDVRLRTPDRPDVRVVVDADGARLELAEPADGPHVELDAAARVLLIWGRRPDRRGRIRSRLPADDLARLQALLAGY